ncbi:DUF4405 domain-containing protein [Methanolobus chelungpuianus]|uniref:DUF4405 domain-containing protein n=1 Tax=Methanolobus chelungpuianus TaxID=502115 RepID=UPI0021147A33|nr:DUF4405 domain-containing protein [Methanolobus chelungpuianus]
MNRSKLNYIVDIPLLAQSFIVSLSGILMYGGKGISYLGLDGREWLHMHEQIGIIMVAFSVIHVVLHWRWMVCLTSNLFRTSKDRASSKCQMEVTAEV